MALTGARSSSIQEKSQAIAAQERACKASVEKRTNDDLAPIAAGRENFTQTTVISANEQKHRQLAKCITDAQRATDELSSKERPEYESRAQEDCDRSTLMMMLITSRPH